MNLRFLYLLRNLSRNPLRSLLTCASVAIPIFIFVLSVAIIRNIDTILNNSLQQLRLAVTNKSSIINPLPAGYRAKIESLDPTRQRLLSVCATRWIGGKMPNTPTPLSTLAVDHDTFVATYSEYELTPEEVAAWERKRNAIVIGEATANQFNWTVGQRITIQSSVPPYSEVEFEIISTAPRSPDKITNFCRRDYLDEVLHISGVQEDWINVFFVKCATQADLDHYRTEIDNLFARSMEPTKTQDEKSFIVEFIRQQFDIHANLKILAAVTVFVAVMAAANTMSMNFRDRFNEFAALRALGFSGGLLFVITQAESLIFCLIGGTIGAVIPYYIFHHTPVKEFVIPIIITVHIEPAVCFQAMLISLAIGAIAAAWPSWQAVRLNVISALRSLE